MTETTKNIWYEKKREKKFFAYCESSNMFTGTTHFLPLD